ncbi:MAG TPA: nucleotide exchange factor GrpE [Solirubrobacteraceae bacterium]|nr:nucleotide exchange factor GrpE [Solirubrobacteraceae bacterium]
MTPKRDTTRPGPGAAAQDAAPAAGPDREPQLDGAGAPKAPAAAKAPPTLKEAPPLKGAPPATEAEAEIGADLDELVAVAAKRDEYLALAQRTQADFENYRKRMAREVSVAEGRGMARLAKELLPALDNLQRALEHSERVDAGPAEGDRPAAADQHLAEGISLVQAELKAALARLGIEAYVPLGECFDPNQHEAMAQHPVEGAEPGTIVEVYQPGYRLRDSVIRPARVVVAA